MRCQYHFLLTENLQDPSSDASKNVALIAEGFFHARCTFLSCHKNLAQYCYVSFAFSNGCVDIASIKFI